MPIDTRQKRASALKVATRFPRAVIPDGTIGAADRQQIAWGYTGMPAVTPPVGIGSRRLLVGMGR